MRRRDGSMKLIAAAIVLVLATAAAVSAATITIINTDAPGVGFNDPTPVMPIGGNLGTTLGQQRLNAFARAAAIWADRLEQTTAGGAEIEIEVEATFDSITDGGGNPLCNQFGGVLGAAGASGFFSNFGAGLANTWYPSALADHVSMMDIDPGFSDISAIFNADVDQTFCLGTRAWYYGYDGNSGQDIDLVSVVVHEIGHGLGFSTVVDLASGAKPSGRDDVYMRWLEDHSTGKLYPNMSNAERVTASTDTGDLHWRGPAVTAFVDDNAAVVFGDFLTDGFDPVSHHMEMYAPFPQEQGSSVSHFTTAAAPNQIMEPSLTQSLHNLELTLALMSDIGWTDIIDCGDADRNGIRAATDALIALQTATTANDCLESLCDPNGDGRVTATDALIMLKGGTGQTVEYNCGLAG